MFPSVTSMIPNKAFINDDFPQPVRPQIPIFSPGEILNENDLITGSISLEYFKVTLLNSIDPLMGQSNGNSKERNKNTN